jgi:cytochrome c biogenesis protein CcmG, thiol:disulfide interchange protein DsbE
VRPRNKCGSALLRNKGRDRKRKLAHLFLWRRKLVPEAVVKGDGTIAYRFVGPISEENYREEILPEIEKASR